MLKRAIDIVITLLILPFLIAAGLIISLLVMIDGGKPFFGHRRVGRNGVEFVCLKFRTMQADAQERLAALLAADADARKEWDATHKLRNDPRVTRIGKFLRKTSLDELPQVLNILRGEMSYVGPRPVTREELSRYGSGAAHYLACRPGITGLWQISGRSDTCYDSRIALDVRYAETRSLPLDLWIMALTIPAVVMGRGAY